MRIGPRLALVIAAVSLTGLTAGCAASGQYAGPPPGTPGVPSATGVPLRVEVNGVPVDDALVDVTQAWSSDGNLVMTTYGSGSCPAVPEVTSVDDEARVIRVRTTVFGGDACTADSRPRTFELDVDTINDLAEFTVEIATG